MIYVTTTCKRGEVDSALEERDYSLLTPEIWVAGLGAVVKRKISCSCHESHLDSSFPSYPSRDIGSAIPLLLSNKLAQAVAPDSYSATIPAKLGRLFVGFLSPSKEIFEYFWLGHDRSLPHSVQIIICWSSLYPASYSVRYLTISFQKP
jgi:hypothetical protein